MITKTRERQNKYLWKCTYQIQLENFTGRVTSRTPLKKCCIMLTFILSLLAIIDLLIKFYWVSIVIIINVQKNQGNIALAAHNQLFRQQARTFSYMDLNHLMIIFDVPCSDAKNLWKIIQKQKQGRLAIALLASNKW